MIKNEYRNFDEQVRDNVKLIGIMTEEDYQEIDEYEFEVDFYEAVDMVTTDEYISDFVENDEVLTIDEFESFRDEFIAESCSQAYGFYKVELLGSKFTAEHERLMIFWNEELDSYIMPIWSQGMPWFMVSVQN